MKPLPPAPTPQAYKEMQYLFDRMNERFFEGKLSQCLITFQRRTGTMGYFAERRFVNTEGHRVNEIALNCEYFGVVPQLELLQTLAHEMVHAWQAEFGKSKPRRCYHNQEWAAKMVAIGLEPFNIEPGKNIQTGEKVADRPIPGGPFMALAKEILDGGFHITWSDVLVPKSTPHIAVHPDIVAALPPSATTPRAELESSKGHFQAKPLPAATDRSNRVRYRCLGYDQCRSQVWGRPDLSIICGQCNQAFAPT